MQMKEKLDNLLTAVRAFLHTDYQPQSKAQMEAWQGLVRAHDSACVEDEPDRGMTNPYRKQYTKPEGGVTHTEEE